MRTLIDVPEPQIRALDVLARDAGSSRAAVIRQAIDAFLTARRPTPTQDGFALWGTGGEDGMDYQDRIRGEW